MTTTTSAPASPAQASDPHPLTDVILTVTNFRNLADTAAGTRFTDYEMQLVTTGGPVSHSNGPFNPPSEPKRTLKCTDKGATLRFAINGNGTTYKPVGVSLVRADGKQPAAVHWGGGHGTGGPKEQISEVTLKNGQIIFKNKIKPSGTPTPVTYEFSILIQRETDGAIGVIDPYLENDNDTAN